MRSPINLCPTELKYLIPPVFLLEARKSEHIGYRFAGLSPAGLRRISGELAGLRFSLVLSPRKHSRISWPSLWRAIIFSDVVAD